MLKWAVLLRVRAFLCESDPVSRTSLVHTVWLPVQRRVEFKIACLVQQSLASLAPTYLTTDIHLVSEYGRRPLRSSTDRTLTVPRTHNRFVDRSFAVAKPCLWNSLPISLRQMTSYKQFRRYPKGHHKAV